MKNQEIELINQLIEMSIVQDKEINNLNHLLNKSNRTVGESPLTFHLKVLKGMLEKEQYNSLDELAVTGDPFGLFVSSMIDKEFIHNEKGIGISFGIIDSDPSLIGDEFLPKKNIIDELNDEFFPRT